MDSKDIFPVHQGYLTKSPPEHGFTGRMKRWLKRWFVLRADKSLEYYDERQGRLLNTIDLSMCKCLDGNLDHKRFQNVFSIKIKGTTEVGKGVDRNYYLVADSPYEMDMWVKEICKICDFQKLDATGLSPKNPKKHPRKEVYEKTSGKAAPIKEYPLAFGQEKMQDRERPDSGIYMPSNENNDIVEPSYDMVPPPLELSAKMSGLSTYDRPQHSGDSNEQPNYDQRSDYDIVPPPRELSAKMSELSTDVPPQQTRVVCPLEPMHTQEHIQNRDSRLNSSAYDDVHPVANAAAHHMEPEQPTYDVPSAILPKTNNAYVNLHIGEDLYNKPLPHIPGAHFHADERDSGTVADITCERTYDVLPTCNYTQSPQDNYPPKIDRSSKPGSAPLLDRSSKPPAKEYVNLSKSSTFREPTRPIHLKSNLQRSQSAVGDSEVDGYLYMESPKRTHSSSKFSKKDYIAMAPSLFEEEDEEKSDEYEFMQAPAGAATDAEYENYEPQQATEGQSNDRTSDYYENYGPADLKQPPNAPPRPLKGQYQDIDIARRQPEALPPAIQPRTNYTTIDLERTRGFRQTCEQSCKRH